MYVYIQCGAYNTAMYQPPFNDLKKKTLSLKSQSSPYITCILYNDEYFKKSIKL